MMLETALIIPDCHVPFHHKALRLTLRVAEYIKPSEIVILGDFCDFFSVSSHSKSPNVFNLLVDEVTAVNKILDEIDKSFPSAQKVFICGNHEHRLERYLCDKAPALFGVTDIKFLLKLNQRPKWKFVPYGPNQMYPVLGSYLYARHEPLGSSTKATAQKAMCSIVHGHTHQMACQYSVGLMGDQHICYSPGFLGDKRRDEVFGYVKHHHQWTLGFSIVHVERKTRLFYPQIIQIIEHDNKLSCVVDGKRFFL